MTRDWKEYNEKLVRRGEFYLSPDFLENWDEELKEMNDGKVGRPYTYPESLVQFAALWYKFFGLPYRQLEGALKSWRTGSQTESFGLHKPLAQVQELGARNP